MNILELYQNIDLRSSLTEMMDWKQVVKHSANVFFERKQSLSLIYQKAASIFNYVENHILSVHEKLSVVICLHQKEFLELKLDTQGVNITCNQGDKIQLLHLIRL